MIVNKVTNKVTKLDYNNGKFKLSTHFSFYQQNSQQIKELFWWNPEGKFWWTRDIKKAASFYQNFKDIIQINQEAQRVITRYLASYAVAPSPNFDTSRLTALRKYQQAGVEWILNTKNTLLADPMGLGKTAQIICSICELVINQGIQKILIIPPAHLKGVWLGEFDKFAYIPLSVVIWKGKHRKEYVVPNWLLGESPLAEVHICNYDILAKHLIHFEELKFDLIVFDESHYLKNKSARRTKCAYKLTNIIPTRIFLTGTPVTKNPLDLWPILEMIKHPLANSWLYFVKRYCNAEKVEVRKGLKVWQFGSSHEEELAQILRSTIMIRRDKQLVLKELPAKNRQAITLDYDEVQELLKREREILLAHKIDLQKINVEEDITIPKVAELAKIRQQLALHKLPAVVSFVDDIMQEQNKLVIFAHHHSVIHTLADMLKKSYSVDTITGEVQTGRDFIIERFQKEKDPQILIVSIQAGGTGITLTAASTAIFVELDWIPANVEQAEDRIHRIGQNDTCNIYYVVIQNSLESYIAQKMLYRQKKIHKIVNS